MSLLIEGEDGSFLPGARPRRAAVRSGLDTHTKAAGGVGSEADKDGRNPPAAPAPGPAPSREALSDFVRGGRLKTKALDLRAASQKKCYNLICPKALQFEGNSDPAQLLNVQ